MRLQLGAQIHARSREKKKKKMSSPTVERRPIGRYTAAPLRDLWYIGTSTELGVSVSIRHATASLNSWLLSRHTCEASSRARHSWLLFEL